VGVVLVPNVLGDHGDIWSGCDSDCEHAWIDKLPPGVIFPAPNFGEAIYCDYKFYAGSNEYFQNARGCVFNMFFYYEEVDFPQQHYGWSYAPFDVGDRKIVKGDGKDLLVFEIMIENESDSPAKLYHEAFKMYDGKDRVFTTITSTMLLGQFPGGSPTEDPAFDWNEACPLYNVYLDIQPGIEERVILCFEIPKDSDHFKVVYDRVNSLTKDRATGMVLLFDRDVIKHQTQQQVAKSTEPTSMSIELLFIALAVVAVSGIVGAVLIAKRGSNTKSAQQKLEEYEDEYLKAGNQAGNQDLEEYEKEYLARQGQRPSPKPARVEKTTLFCDNCGTPFKSEARFCDECGTPRS
jgi:hypothetical protein